MREREYNREAVVEYARRWALKRNPRFYDFSKIGGDCTNFASQCVYAGAKVMNYTPIFGWFYRSASDRTASWTGVEYFYNFLTQNNSAGPYAREVDEAEVQIGDVVQLGNANGYFYHSPIIVATAPRILVAAHSEDVFGKPLSRYTFAAVRFLHIAGVRAG